MRQTYSGSCKLEGKYRSLPQRQDTRSTAWVEVRADQGSRADGKSSIASVLPSLIQELILLGQMALQQEDAVTACSLLEASATLARQIHQEHNSAESSSLSSWGFVLQGNDAAADVLTKERLLHSRKGAEREAIVPGAELSAREVEVLRLVAQGMTDAQVAEHLVISRRTVNWHLTAIYSKLGVSSRSAATRYALEQQVI